MKTISLLTRFLTLSFFISLLTVSCKKENSTTTELSPQEEEQASIASSQADAESESIFNDIFDDVMGVSDDVGMSGTGIFGRQASTPDRNGRIQNIDSVRCFTVSVTHLTPGQLFPLKIVIDFGAGCTGPDGRTRYGKIVTEYTGRLIMPGKSATTTFIGFKIDSISVEGTHKIMNTSSATHRQFTVDVTDAKLSKPSGNYTKWNSHRVITQAEGLGTPAWPVDDIFTITGNSSGQVKRGALTVNWTANITEPLFKKFNCKWIVKGKVKITRQNQAATSPWIAVLDYGNGSCDYLATLTINGIVHNIQLPH